MGSAGVLHEIDRAALEPPVRQALGSATATVQTWRSESLGGGIGAPLGGGVPRRIAGTARDGELMRSWSLVLKVLHAPATANMFNQPDPGGMFYWKRDALVYGSGLLDGLPSGLAAPRCYAIGEHADGIRLWLEDVTETSGRRWPLARYAEAARHLGRFNGAGPTGRALPEASWLCRDLLRWRVPLVAPFWEGLADRRGDPRVRRGWPGDLADRAARVWAERERFLAALDGLPRVFCHGDADRRNLLARDTADGTAETVAVDWACAGVRAVGTDLANLVAASVLWARDPDPADLAELSRLCATGYLAGLREAGWAGEERDVRLGYALTVALQFGAFTGAIVGVLAGEDERARYEAAFGTLEAVLDRHAALQPFVLDLADEARTLLGGR
jgi:hypothetical protein